MEVNFIFKDRELDSVKIPFKPDDKLSQIFDSFASNVGEKASDFEYFCKGKKIEDTDLTFPEVKNNNNARKNEITVMQRSKIMKCPKCVCNNAIIKIEDYKLKFSECRYHHEEIHPFDDYEKTQAINYEKIKCNNDKCGKTQKEELKDFKNCFGCSKVPKFPIYYCKDCCGKGKNIKGCNKNHKMIDYSEKYYYCPDHIKEFMSYCKDCKTNICEQCENNHNNHQIVRFDPMIKNINVKSLESKLETIKEKAEQLQIIVREIKNMMDKAVETIEKYYYIGKDIIEKYKSYNSKLKNFQVLQTIKNLSYSNKVIIKDLDDIISMNPSQFKSEKELWISKCTKLIAIYLGDRGINRENNNNKDTQSINLNVYREETKIEDGKDEDSSNNSRNGQDNNIQSNNTKNKRKKSQNKNK